jgi:hypothetical protein
VRLSKNCQELGERPSSKVCPAFEANKREEDVSKPEVPVADVAALVKQELGSLGKASHEELFKEIASEQFVVKHDAYLAMFGIKTILQQQGARTEMDDRDFNRYIDKLSRLYLLHRLTLILGLAPYLDHIMANEIDNLFTTITQKVQHPQRKQPRVQEAPSE